MASSDVIGAVKDLGDRVNGHPEHVATVVPQLIALLDDQREPLVIAAIVDALNKASDEVASLEALRFVDHSDDSVRLAVAHALPAGVESPLGTSLAAAGLMQLTRDPVDEIRDWSTFGLGSQLNVDTTEVREALWARIDDASQMIRDEAAVGLAQRRDRRAVQLVADRLTDEDAGPLVFEAAEYLADPRLHDALRRWSAARPDDEAIRRAMHACDGDFQRTRTTRQAELLEAIGRLLTDRVELTALAMFCDLQGTDVVMQVDESGRVWNVDSLLARAGHDIERAAQLGLSDLAR